MFFRIWKGSLPAFRCYSWTLVDTYTGRLLGKMWFSMFWINKINNIVPTTLCLSRQLLVYKSLYSSGIKHAVKILKWENFESNHLHEKILGWENGLCCKNVFVILNPLIISLSFRYCFCIQQTLYCHSIHSLSIQKCIFSYCWLQDPIQRMGY